MYADKIFLLLIVLVTARLSQQSIFSQEMIEAVMLLKDSLTTTAATPSHQIVTHCTLIEVDVKFGYLLHIYQTFDGKF